MGKFQRHDPCPSCGSRDNLGVWDDGSWCYGCGHRIPGYKGLSRDDLKRQLAYQEDSERKRARKPYLPEDFSLDIPELPLGWLRKYQITDEERQRYRIGWSQSESSLVFSAFDVWGNLLLVQLRRFPTKEFYTRGYPETVLWSAFVSGSNSASIVVVEDYISAIRVGRTMEAMPLWGSNLSMNHIRRLSDRYEHLFIWLDFDKAGHALKTRIKALPYFKTVSTVVTELDPKDYTDEHIAQSLGCLP